MGTSRTRFDPSWNFLPRTLLIYSLPLALLAICLEAGWTGSPAFWVALLWGLAIPGLNIPLRAGRPWAFKDYQDRDYYPVTIAVLHGAVWALGVNLAPSVTWAAAGFFVFFFAYDCLLVHYGLLVVYAIGIETHRRGALAVVAKFGLLWWGYVAAGLGLIQVVGENSLASVALCFLAMFGPAQLGLLYLRLRRDRPETFGKIRRVAVVGAGWAGLYATKWLVESGLEVCCFEAEGVPGGVWQFSQEREGGVAESTRATSSKHFLHASDFPMGTSLSDFPEHAEVLDYLQAYAAHFDLHRHIVSGARVESVVKSGEGWRVAVRHVGGILQEEFFDAVCVCAGPHQQPRIDPSTHPLYSRFTGELTHACQYKCASDIDAGATVLVVGAGESAADIVAECAAQGASVYWASRRGQWFADRHIGPFPADHFTAVGLRVLVGRFLFFEYLIRRFVIAPFIHLAWGRGGHGIPEWFPRAPYLHQFINKSRDGIREVYRGRVRPQRGIAAIQGRRVWFEGRPEPAEVSRIILATGYAPSWDFLEKRPRGLFKLVFCGDDPTLAFVGYVRPVLGSIPSLGELQARWLAGVWAGRTSLPCRRRRQTIAWVDRIHQRRRMLDSSVLGVLVDQEAYATQLAGFAGAQVRWLRLLFTSPRALVWALRSPWTAFKYRLHDSDPRTRKQALENIIAEMPERRSPGFGGHPVFLLNRAIIALAVGALVAAAGAFWLLPTPVVVAGAAGLLAVAGLILRLTEESQPRGDSRPRRIDRSRTRRTPNRRQKVGRRTRA